MLMKILMVGLGGIGQRHVRNLRTLMGSEIEILAFRFRNNSQVLTDQLRIEEGSSLEEKYAIRVYADLDQALAQKPEAVFVCNPSSLHVPIALRAAQAGCHLFVEKPLSHNFEQVEELINLVESRNIKAVVGYQMRFHPCLQRLYALIQERSIGRILTVRAEVGEYLPGWHTYEDYRQMYASKQELGGGVILSQIHELDYLYWLFGLPRRVFALGGQMSSLDVDVEDTVEILMECVMDGRCVPVSVHQDYVQRPPSRACQIIGDAGKILVDLRALTVDVFDSLGNQVESTSYEGFQRNQLFLDELKYFLECLQGKQTPLVEIRAGAQSLRMALAAKESLATGKVIDLSR
ncbi:MAG: Gfo/Idh/MocA family oxidoreductase, partial [Anaerolineales bacterium]|nr:Gfo/Idh/MocA family oxidoreductase [Anaerolineales bacterium]